MDKEELLKIVRSFLNVVRKSGFKVAEAYIFGSMARGTAHPDSDIDVALLIEDLGNSFDAQVKLMHLRHSVDDRIEPHPFHAGDDDPFLREAVATGIRVA
jgi:predicted nucleotidyltransferase